METRPVYPDKACDHAGEHEPHLWLETGIPTGNPLVEYTQWWQCGEPEVTDRDAL